jgi:hypothetical protein
LARLVSEGLGTACPQQLACLIMLNTATRTRQCWDASAKLSAAQHVVANGCVQAAHVHSFGLRACAMFAPCFSLMLGCPIQL